MVGLETFGPKLGLKFDMRERGSAKQAFCPNAMYKVEGLA